MTDLTMSQFASKDDLLAAQAARIAELESQLEAIGAGGVEPLRKPAAAQQAEPFMWAIQEPGGSAYMDENCVSTSRGIVEAEVDGLNLGLGADDEPYKVVPVYLAATQPAAQGMDAGKLLAEKHTGMKVDYRGLLGQVQREIERSAPGHAEMLRQLQGHLQELGQRWYAGDTAVVDELLQLYCVERQARADLAAQAKQGGA